MRIGLFTTDFPLRAPFMMEGEDVTEYRWGGVAEVVYHLALLLNSLGHTVLVFSTSPTRREIIQRFQNITVYRYGKDIQVASTLLSSGLLWRPLRHDLDVVHGHLGTPPGAFAAYFYSKMKRTPLVVTVHSAYNEVAMQGGSLARRLSLSLFSKYFCSPLLKGATRITAVSLPVLEDSPPLREFIHRTTIIPNGVDLTSLRVERSKEECRRLLEIGPEKKVVLYVGSLSTYKDPETLVRAFGALERGRADSLLVMIGDGPLKGEIIDLASNGGFLDRIRLTGFIPEGEKLMYFKAADVFILPSLGDSFGIVILEAGAFSLPIIASDLTVFGSIIKDGRDGLLFRKRDDGDLRQKLEGLLEDQESRRSLGDQARLTAERYDWLTILEKYVDIFQDIASARTVRK